MFETCPQPNIQGLCELGLEHPPAIDGIRAPYLFEGPLREAAHRLKWSFLSHGKQARSRSQTGLLQAGSLGPFPLEGWHPGNQGAGVSWPLLASDTPSFPGSMTAGSLPGHKDMDEAP